MKPIPTKEELELDEALRYGWRPTYSSKRGRKPKGQRCVVQVRVRQGGKVFSVCSYTIDMPPNQVMKIIQESFPREKLLH